MSGCCSIISKELSLSFLCTHTHTHTRTPCWSTTAKVDDESPALGPRWMQLMECCHLGLLLDVFVCFSILFPPVKMCERGFCAHLNPESFYFFFNKHTLTFFFLAPLNHLCQGHKSKTPSADRWIEVCVFPPVCTRESRHFISFNSRVFPRRKRADPSGQLCIQRNIVVCRGAALDTHLHLDSVCGG